MIILDLYIFSEEPKDLGCDSFVFCERNKLKNLGKFISLGWALILCSDIFLCFFEVLDKNV